MSKLDSEYLEKLAKEIGGFYVDGQSYRAVKKEMKKQPPAWKAPDQFYLQPILCFLALFFIARFISKANITSQLENYMMLVNLLDHYSIIEISGKIT